MCTSKKVAIAVGAVVAGVLLLGTPVGSYVWSKGQTAVSGVFNWCERSVTPEEKLRAIQAKTGKINKEIQRNFDVLAQMEGEYERIEKQASGLKLDVEGRKAELEALTKAVESGDLRVSVGGKSLRQSDLLRELDTKTTQFQAKKVELAQTQNVVAAKRQALDAAHAKIVALKTQREELKAKIAELEARIQMVRLNQVNAKVEVDASLTNEIHGDLNKLEQHLRTLEIKTDLQKKYGDNPTANGPAGDGRSKEDLINAARKALNEETAAVAVDKK